MQQIKNITSSGKLLITIFIILPFLLTGCVYDDLSDCDSSVSLRMIYTLNEDYADKFSDYVGYVDFYIYNEENELVHEEQVSLSDLIEGNTHRLELTPGSYTSVIWGNLDPGDYILSKKEELTAMNLLLRRDSENKVDFEPADLFHGMTSFEVETTRATEKTVPLVKNTNHIRILVEVPVSLRSYPGTDYSVRIYGSNGEYGYNNSRIASRQLQYIPSYSKYTSYTDYIRADFSLMRLFIGDGMRIMIMDQTEVVLLESLTDLLLQSPIINSNEDLDRYDNYTLFFSIDDEGNYILSSIQVEDWNEIWEPGGEI